MADGPLAGLRVLVVEDETLIAMLIEEMLSELGCVEVWHAGGVQGALALLDIQRPDAVLLDVNLAGDRPDAICSRLAAERIPFAFATGYGESGVERAWAGRKVVQKPFTANDLATALTAALHGAG